VIELSLNEDCTRVNNKHGRYHCCPTNTKKVQYEHRTLLLTCTASWLIRWRPRWAQLRDCYAIFSWQPFAVTSKHNIIKNSYGSYLSPTNWQTYVGTNVKWPGVLLIVKSSCWSCNMLRLHDQTINDGRGGVFRRDQCKFEGKGHSVSTTARYEDGTNRCKMATDPIIPW